MTAQTIGVYTEDTPGERRVALVPAVVARIRGLGLDVLIERGAGSRTGIADEGYTAEGARLGSRQDLFDTATLLAGVRPPVNPFGHRFRRGQALLCLMQPLRIPLRIRDWADQGLTAIALDLLPPTFSTPRPAHAGSEDYATIVGNLLEHLVRDGALTIDLTDPLQATMVVTHDRHVLNGAVWQRILAEIAIAGLP
ncbi:hypothetical protein [Amycolatopsis sp. NPDC051903]|uniref:hypothetical protein n=1 Tax=Amycolatopsis sp. NPDC051903 TaxID=3363936 RepID=UPI0037A2951C